MTNVTAPRSNFFVGTDVAVRFKGSDDNAKCMVDQWAIKLGEKLFLANLILPHAAPEGARWLLGSVATPKNMSVWGYKDDQRVKNGFEGHVFTVAVDTVTYLVFLTKGKAAHVAHVVPLTEILEGHEAEVSLDVALERKKAVADTLGYAVQYTDTESVFIKYRAELARQQEEARRAAEAEEREALRQAKVAQILARKHVRVYADGKWVEAIWVIEGEWQMLPPRTVVVLGAIETEKGGQSLFVPRETFTVFKGTKRGSEPEKAHVHKVGLEPTKATASSLPEPVAKKVVLLEGKPFEVPSFGSIEDLEAHRLAGLNSGAVRGVMTSGRLELYRVRKDGIESVKAETFTVIG